MESFLNRYRNITVLLLAIFAQLVLLAVQVKNDQDVHLIRVWTVTAVTPMARLLEGFRGGGVGFLRNYILLHDADAENRRLKAQVDQLKIENIFLKNELSSAERAKALQLFQEHTPSKMLAARVISSGAGSNSRVVYVDRTSADGVMRGMAVVTPDGIVGKVIAAYPTASEVLLATDPDFAAGVISQKGQARGTFKGQGTPLGRVDYVPSEEKVAEGEWFYTSGDDRIFPRGFPVGQARAVRTRQPFQEILVDPSGLQRGVEDVLIVMQGVHQEIPTTAPLNQPVYIAPPPAVTTAAPAETNGVPLAPGGTVADKLRQQYQAVGDAEHHTFGEGIPGSAPPDFTKLGKIAGSPAAAAAPANGASGSSASPNAPTAPATGRTPVTEGHAPGATSPAAGPASGSSAPPPNSSTVPVAPEKRLPDATNKPTSAPPAGRAPTATSPATDPTAPAAKRPSDPTKKPTSPGGPGGMAYANPSARSPAARSTAPAPPPATNIAGLE